MKLFTSFILLLVSLSINAQEKQADSTTKKDVDQQTVSRTPIEYIPYVCQDSTIKYIVIDTTSKYYYLAVANNNRNIISDSLYFQSNYNDETVSNFLEKVLGGSACYNNNKQLLLATIRNKINELFQTESSSKDKRTVDSLVNELEQEFTAGQFRSIGREIPVYNVDSEKNKGDSTWQNAYKRRNKAKDTVFIAEKIILRTDYNRISTIAVAGTLRYRDTTSKKDTTLRLVIKNESYSLTFSGLNDGEYLRRLPVFSNHSPYVNFADIIQYEPFGNEMTYIVANQSLEVPIGGTVNVKKRKLSDYVSFRTFLDPLGFLGSNPNGFAQLEGDAIIPMALRSGGKNTWFPQANVNFNYIYSNSINSEPRIAPVYSLRNTVRPDNVSPLLPTDTSRYISNLDVAKYAYYQLKANLSFLTVELKSWSSWVHFEEGVRVLGSRADTATSKTIPVHKFIPEVRLRLEIRPDYIIGASMSLGLAWLGNTHKGNNTPQNIRDVSFLYKSPFAIPHETSVYAITGNGTGGLFFRYIGWLAFHRKIADGINTQRLPDNLEIRKTSYFPQILVGYSTNLSAIVNRVPKQRGTQ